MAATPTSVATQPPSGTSDLTADLRVTKRDGAETGFDATKISIALTKAFLDVGGDEAAASSRVRATVDDLTTRVVEAVARNGARQVHIEDVQDQVELALMRAGEHEVARSYVLYRDERARARSAAVVPAPSQSALRVTTADGTQAPLDLDALSALIDEACDGIDGVDPDALVAATQRDLYDGITAAELAQATVLAARTRVESEPRYGAVAARLLGAIIRNEVLSHLLGEPVEVTRDELSARYADAFTRYVRHGISVGMLDAELADLDLERLGAAIRPDRDLGISYLGLQTLYDRYLLHDDGVRYELPQAFFMRVAMGLALREVDREARAIEFYEALSTFDLMCSTPTLFNAGTTRPQLSSCFLTTVTDDLDAIFQSFQNNALLAKFSGGLGNDWTPVRGLGARIRGTNGTSSGVVPFLKIANDTAVAVNQGGKRKGAVCAYLETWHIDIEEFLDLRKNTGDDRRRTHDMNTANWIPDLFIQRVEADGHWTLFSPDEVGDLHDLCGADFASAYVAYEEAAQRGEIRVWRQVRAVDLWRRMLTVLFETGHPWMTFKDACNVRSPQGHVGTVHSSNLCTEITLNTAPEEVAVCNLASVNLVNHTGPDGIDADHLGRTVRTAMRMLDNVIDINLYTIPEARRSNLRHRPVGLGLMGFHDALMIQRIPYASERAVAFADTSMEVISYHAIAASSDLAVERGAYPSFEGSRWSRGELPIDTVAELAAHRDGDLDQDTSHTLDWDGLRARVVAQGMRNSNTMAIAPTATISNICGVSQSIEPQYANLYVKSNMSGDFTVINPRLVADLAARGLWDQVMIDDLKYFDGVLAPITRIPDDLKELYATAFEVDPSWLIQAGSRRQKWIDQAQSLNLYVAQPDGPMLDRLYRTAWRSGLKTTYYLRSRGATHVEKSTLAGTDGRLNAVPLAVDAAPATSPPPVVPERSGEPGATACSIEDPDCEACQ